MKAIIIGQGNPYIKNPYLSKLSEVLETCGVSYEFWVWDRDGGLDALPRVKVLLHFGSWGGGAVNILGYFVWQLWLFSHIFLKPRRGVFFCSRLDSALPCALVSLFRRCDYVFLDRDKLSKSHSWPLPFKKLIQLIERFVGKRAVIHVIPGASRRDSSSEHESQSNLRIVRNTPHSEVIARARKIHELAAPRSKRLRVLISGLISPERGAQMMLGAVERLRMDNVEFIAAGRLLGEHAKRLAEILGSNYRGLVNNETALAMLLDSDVVLAFYDPDLEINRLAEPNKWFDCAALRVPFITNYGLLTSGPFEENESCFFCRYGAVDQLALLLKDLSENRSLLESRRNGLDSLTYEPWDMAMAKVVADCTRISQSH